jgi:putative ABC transport system substrate-binding protein
LKEAGYVEGENVTVEYRWAENQIDRLPELAAALVQRQVAVIVTAAPPAAVAAKAATAKIPIVFGVGGDPIELGLVASLNRPGGNLTGINFLSRELGGKRLELLREMVPSAIRVTVLVDPTFPLTAALLRDVVTAAPTMGLQIQVLNVTTSSEINAAFASFARERPDALFVGTGPFLARADEVIGIGQDVRYWLIPADMAVCPARVCFWGRSGHRTNWQKRRSVVCYFPPRRPIAKC